jgi:hypothetical protein
MLCDYCLPDIIFVASQGHVSCLKHCLAESVHWPDYTTLHAARWGNLNIIEYAYQHHMHIHNMTAYEAYRYHQYDILYYLFDHEDILYTQDINFLQFDAAWYGSIEVLELIHQHRVEWIHDISSCLARRKHFNCLEYVLTHGAPLHPSTVCLLNTHANDLVELFEYRPWWRSFILGLTAEQLLHCEHLETMIRTYHRRLLYYNQILNDIAETYDIPFDLITYVIHDFL